MTVSGIEPVPAGLDAGIEPLEVEGEVAARSPRQLFWRRFRRDKVAVVSGIIILVEIAIAFLAPVIVKILGLPGPLVQNPNLTDSFGSPLGPSWSHPFGVDTLGHDLLARVIYGTRVSLTVGIVGTAIATLIGVTVGMLAGYYKGSVDTVLSRLLDVVLSIPPLLLGLGIAAACSVRACVQGVVQPGVGTVIFLISLVTWPYMARIVRGLVLSLREREFVEASHAFGASNARIMFREILPNLAAPIIVYATLQVPLNILFEAALSFLGIGIRPPSVSWGQMISEATPIFNTAWWFMVFPGAALLITVLAFNLLGDGLRDALNPRYAR
ncbi:MAG TPA: ABC transporter permease [Solirubrobacteraceae bacterium]|nr:ABC transporter permease [Solirubrobacteraceae bacterium]